MSTHTDNREPRLGGADRHAAWSALVGKAARAWSQRPVRIGIAVGLVAVLALALGLMVPRGPITATEALTAIFLAAGVGFAAGYATRSRWAMLAAPLVFVGVFELTRLGEVGPTVDGIHLGSAYGIIAIITGRFFDGVLVLVPMMLGVAFGAGLARRQQPPPSTAPTRRHRIGVYLRRGFAGVATAGLVALAVFIAKPATTDPIRGADGRTLAGSVAELTRVELGGSPQAMMIRGHSVEAPVMLFLAGGPGGSEIGSMRNLSSNLERDFVVATWDQRGTGKSVSAFDPDFTLDRAIDETIQATDYLRNRFDEQKIYLVGNSWGSLLGVLAAKKRPDLYHAFVGTGQMVSTVATDRMFYEDTLAWATRTGDSGLVDTLRENGPPPYEEILNYEAALSHEHDWNDYPGLDAIQDKGEMPGNIFVEEYSLMEKLRLMGGVLDTFSVLYPQLDGIDLRRDAATLDVPVYLAQGVYEARGRAVPAREWFGQLKAPRKQFITFPRSGHKSSFEEPDRFATIMRETVLAQTNPRRAQQRTTP